MRGQFTEQLLSRAERDPEFRKQLIEDPSSAIEEELGIDLPEGIRVRVVQEDRTRRFSWCPGISSLDRLPTRSSSR